MRVYFKDPDDVLDYAIDYGKKWLKGGDTIVTSTYLIDAGITKVSDTHTTMMTTIWLSGGTADTQYKVTNRITTAQGRQKDITLRIHVREE